MKEQGSYYANRLPELDILRGLAIVFVLFRHYPVTDAFAQGWIGVDLFFTLSGFLIGGMLIVEYQRIGKVNIGRFLLRRGLKIYPSFYFFLVSTALLAWVAQSLGKPLFWPVLAWKPLLVETFYLQSFGGGTWPHTWSLAIEEHFYLILALLVFLLSGWKRIIRKLALVSLLTVPVCLALRLVTAARLPEFEYIPHYVNTFLRLDSLFFGVFLACLDQLFPALWKRLPAYFYGIVSLLGIALLVGWLSAHPLEDMATVKFGFTIIYAGFGAVLLAITGYRHKTGGRSSDWLNRQKWTHPLVFMGRQSYNIYLWHVFAMQAMMFLTHKFLDVSFFDPMTLYFFAAYFLLSVLMGTVATKCIELPILQWRNRRFPNSRKQNEGIA